MQHTHFQATQTAAVYVGGGLDENALEAFEVHLLDCRECLEDVEVWRAIKQEMRERPRKGRTGTFGHRFVFSELQMAASLVGAGFIGAAGGWLGRATLSSDVDSAHTIVFNLPAVSRGADECTPMRLAPDTRLALIRVPGVPRDLRVVALDSEMRDLPGVRYSATYQPDGSQLVRLESLLLTGKPVYLEGRRGANGSGEPLGCVMGEIVETAKPGDTRRGRWQH